MNKCKICDKELFRIDANTCGGKCNREYTKMRAMDGFIETRRKLIKEVNRGFCWDESNDKMWG